MKAIDQFIFDLPPHQQEIILHLQQVIMDSHPKMKSAFKYGCPFYVYKKNLCYINPRKDDIVIGFVQGKLLEKTNPYLTGDQKQIRHLVIDKLNEEKHRQLQETVQRAIALQETLY